MLKKLAGAAVIALALLPGGAAVADAGTTTDASFEMTLDRTGTVDEEGQVALRVAYRCTLPERTFAGTEIQLGWIHQPAKGPNQAGGYISGGPQQADMECDGAWHTFTTSFSYASQKLFRPGAAVVEGLVAEVCYLNEGTGAGECLALTIAEHQFVILRLQR